MISKVQTRQRRITIKEDVQKRDNKYIPSGILAVLINWFLPLISWQSQPNAILTLHHPELIGKVEIGGTQYPAVRKQVFGSGDNGFVALLASRSDHNVRHATIKRENILRMTCPIGKPLTCKCRYP
jgi:hypothetical protein